MLSSRKWKYWSKVQYSSKLLLVSALRLRFFYSSNYEWSVFLIINWYRCRPWNNHISSLTPYTIGTEVGWNVTLLIAFIEKCLKDKFQLYRTQYWKVLKGFLIKKKKYLSIWLDQKLAFKFHINTLVSKLRQTIGYLYRSGTTCSAWHGSLKLSLSVLDYGDVLCYLFFH